MTSPIHTRPDPSAVPDVPLQALAALLQTHASALTDPHLALGDSRAAGDHAVAALVLQTALLQRVPESRWGLVERGLRAGVDLQRLADAAGYADVEELRVGYVFALEVRVRDQHVTPAERDMLLRLLDDGDR